MSETRQLKLTNRKNTDGVIREIYEIGKYTVCADLFAGGGIYITLEKEPDDYLPFIQCNSNSYGEILGFHVETTSYGSLSPEEIIKVIDGLKEAKEVAEILTEKFIKKGNLKKKHPKTEFEYHGFHFIPQEHLPIEMTSLEAMSNHIRSDHNLGFSDYEWGKIPYSSDDFYVAHGYKVNGEYYFDTFLCKETGKVYIPGEHELFEWNDKPQKISDIKENLGNRLVRFVNLLEKENMIPHHGILLQDKTIICFCCGEILEPKSYVILEDNIPWQYLDKTTKEHL